MNNFLTELFAVYPGITPDASWAPDPTAFSLGSLEIRWYGIFFTLGFILAIAAACVKLEYWYKVSSNPFYWFVFIGIPVSLLGARIWSFVIGDAAKLLETENFFVAFFDFRQGGLAIQGGVLFTVLAACIYFPLILKKPKYNVKTKIGEDLYVKQVSMWVYADAIIPCILIGQIIGRWGNFMNQEVYGPAVAPENIASMNWLRDFMPAVWKGMFIKDSSGAYTFHQPFFLYESMINFVFLIILYVGAEFVKFRKAGDIGIAYFFLYGLVRLCMEPFRDGPFKFSFSIVTSVLFIVVAVVLIVLNHAVFAKNRQVKCWDFIFYKIKVWSKSFIALFNKNMIQQNMSAEEKKAHFEKNFIRKDTEIYFYNGH